jgi:hypothetical protein
MAIFLTEGVANTLFILNSGLAGGASVLSSESFIVSVGGDWAFKINNKSKIK